MKNSDSSLLTDAVKHITSSLKVDSEKIKATFSFLPPPNSDNEIIALAIEQILKKYFKITLPESSKAEIKSGNPFTYEDTSVAGLPSRTINTVLAPEHCQFGIKGKSSSDGEDSYSELFYSWQKEAGVVDEIGNIDLKRTNALTGVKQGEHLATIHLATVGQPGIQADGKKIKQKVGKSAKIKIDEKTICRTDDPEGLIYHLYAECSGVVKSVFSRSKDPKTLTEINIHDIVVVNGDINYGVGDQGSIDGEGDDCPFSLNIKGNVKGAFSLQSDGFIHVSGTIEGKSVSAQEIKAELLTGRCIATAKDEISVQSIVNATANAKHVVVKKNASGSTLKSSELVTLDKNTNCVGMTIETKRFESFQNNFSGQNHIFFNQDLFQELKSVSKKLKQTEREARQLSAPNKDIATAMLTDIARIETVVSKTRSPSNKQISPIIDELKLTIVNAIQSAGKQVSKDTITRCQQLQTKLGEAKYHESLLIKVDTLITHIKKYNITASQLYEILQGEQERKNLAHSLEQQIRNELIITLQQPKLIGHSASLHVHCGEVEEIYTGDQLRGNNIEIKYIAPKEEDISKGKLKLKKD